ncbi:prolyl 4-hydroxylase subunit alpha-1-like [Drosophila albomicans]|uniref:Prolyl 4-hydroxylase subunit alpha-1-like n=1 Tax=Drosophila albomicans TaxID=7291 RepID=A0A9C6WH02_DROAB|nr:prolyl 4-hydroxylase subunit alpha-1-like [Drosophila albomicans]
MEQISMDPDIFVFHNVISSAEIAILDREMEAFLVPAKVATPEGEKVSSYRTVKSVRLPHVNVSREVNLLAVRLHKRMSDLSDFNLDSYSDVMQVLKYDFGGHASIHNDYFKNSSSEDRIATILFYLNDVSSGGGTVFFDLNLTVQPEPGKAVLWYNLNLDTFDYEERNIHASCPVKIGSKFALTQWVLEHRQMFNRPCLRPPKLRQYK